MSRLENWTLMGNGSLHGQVFDDHRWPDTTWIVTSTVRSLDLVAKKAVTRNSTYELGEAVSHGTVLAQQGEL